MTTTTYTPLNNVASIIDPLGHTSVVHYDAAGRQIAVTNAESETTTSVYDATSRIIAVVNPLGNRTTTAYDRTGQPVLLMNALGQVTTTTYDAAGRAVAVTNPLGKPQRPSLTARIARSLSSILCWKRTRLSTMQPVA